MDKITQLKTLLTYKFPTYSIDTFPAVQSANFITGTYKILLKNQRDGVKGVGFESFLFDLEITSTSRENVETMKTALENYSSKYLSSGYDGFVSFTGTITATTNDFNIKNVLNDDIATSSDNSFPLIGFNDNPLYYQSSIWRFEFSINLKNAVVSVATLKTYSTNTANTGNSYIYAIDSDDFSDSDVAEYKAGSKAVDKTTAVITHDSDQTDETWEEVNVLTLVQEVIARAGFDSSKLGMYWKPTINTTIFLSFEQYEDENPAQLILTLRSPSFPYWLEFHGGKIEPVNGQYIGKILMEARWEI